MFGFISKAKHEEIVSQWIDIGAGLAIEVGEMSRALRDISNMETPGSAPTAKRMARRARQGLEGE